jgi:site-specific DNA-methyltransferase (adenine-specific)/modification methylase
MEKVTIGNAELYCGDCAVILPQLDKVDLILTDPPYGIDVGKMGMGKGKKATQFDSFDWDAQKPLPWLFGLMEAKAQSLIIWGGNYFGLPASGCWLSWDKVQEFSGADFELAYTNLTKPSKAFRMSRVEAYGSIERQHPTQKPVRLMEWCIDKAPEDIATICDPFMGSGTTGVAAMNMERKFIGIERERKYFDIACARIEAAQAQGRLAI